MMVAIGHASWIRRSGERESKPGRSRPARWVVGIGLETKEGDSGAPDGDGLQRREGLVSGDGNVLGGATGGEVSVQGAKPCLVPPRPKAGGGRSLDGEDHGDKFTVYSSAAGAMLVVLGGFPTLEDKARNRYCLLTG